MCAQMERDHRWLGSDSLSGNIRSKRSAYPFPSVEEAGNDPKGL